MKNILIVSCFFYPVNTPRAFRTTELVKELCSRGHNVTLLIPEKHQAHDSFIRNYGVRIRYFGPLKFEQININSDIRFKRLIKKVLRRVGRQFFEYPEIEHMYRVKKALENESGYDLIISIAYPHSVHWGVTWAKKNNKVANLWVADCGDPFMGQDMHHFKKPLYFTYLERWFCKKADYISVPTEESREAYYEEYHDKIKVIPQGFDFSEIPQKRGKENNEVPIFAYAGTLYRKNRNPRKFLKYLTEKRKEFRFILYTNQQNLVKNYLDSEEKRIELRSYIPRKELLKELSKMDFLVNISNANTGVQVPSKLIDYYLTGRPVLSIHPEDFNEKKVDEFLSGNYSQRYQYENIDRYKIENVVDQFLNLL